MHKNRKSMKYIKKIISLILIFTILSAGVNPALFAQSNKFHNVDLGKVFKETQDSLYIESTRGGLSYPMAKWLSDQKKQEQATLEHIDDEAAVLNHNSDLLNSYKNQAAQDYRAAQDEAAGVTDAEKYLNILSSAGSSAKDKAAARAFFTAQFKKFPLPKEYAALSKELDYDGADAGKIDKEIKRLRNTLNKPRTNFDNPDPKLLSVRARESETVNKKITALNKVSALRQQNITVIRRHELAAAALAVKTPQDAKKAADIMREALSDVSARQLLAEQDLDKAQKSLDDRAALEKQMRADSGFIDTKINAFLADLKQVINDPTQSGPAKNTAALHMADYIQLGEIPPADAAPLIDSIVQYAVTAYGKCASLKGYAASGFCNDAAQAIAALGVVLNAPAGKKLGIKYIDATTYEPKQRIVDQNYMQAMEDYYGKKINNRNYIREFLYKIIQTKPAQSFELGGWTTIFYMITDSSKISSGAKEIDNFSTNYSKLVNATEGALLIYDGVDALRIIVKIAEKGMMRSLGGNLMPYLGAYPREEMLINSAFGYINLLAAGEMEAYPDADADKQTAVDFAKDFVKGQNSISTMLSAANVLAEYKDYAAQSDRTAAANIVKTLYCRQKPVENYEYGETAAFKNALADVYLRIRQDKISTRPTTQDKKQEERMNKARELNGEVIFSQNGREEFIEETLVPNKYEAAAGKPIPSTRDDGPVKGIYLQSCYVAPENGIDVALKADLWCRNSMDAAQVPLYFVIPGYWMIGSASSIIEAATKPGGQDWLDMAFLASAIVGGRFASANTVSKAAKMALKELGLKPGATTEEINAAYKKIALETHPDKWSHVSPAERAAKEALFKKAGAARDFLTGEYNYGGFIKKYSTLPKALPEAGGEDKALSTLGLKPRFTAGAGGVAEGASSKTISNKQIKDAYTKARWAYEEYVRAHNGTPNWDLYNKYMDQKKAYEYLVKYRGIK